MCLCRKTYVEMSIKMWDNFLSVTQRLQHLHDRYRSYEMYIDASIQYCSSISSW